MSGPPDTDRRWPGHGRVRTTGEDPHRRGEHGDRGLTDDLQQEVGEVTDYLQEEDQEVADYLQEEDQEVVVIGPQAGIGNHQEEAGVLESLLLHPLLPPRRVGTTTMKGPCLET